MRDTKTDEIILESRKLIHKSISSTAQYQKILIELNEARYQIKRTLTESREIINKIKKDSPIENLLRIKARR